MLRQRLSAPAKEGESPGGGLLVSRQGARSLSQAGTSGGEGVSNLLCGDFANCEIDLALRVGARPPHWVLGGHFGDGVNSC